MTMRNFIKYMACNIDQKKIDTLDRLHLKLEWQKKKKCDELGKKWIKELENRSV